MSKVSTAIKERLQIDEPTDKINMINECRKFRKKIVWLFFYSYSATLILGLCLVLQLQMNGEELQYQTKPMEKNRCFYLIFLYLWIGLVKMDALEILVYTIISVRMIIIAMVINAKTTNNISAVLDNSLYISKTICTSGFVMWRIIPAPPQAVIRY